MFKRVFYLFICYPVSSVFGVYVLYMRARWACLVILPEEALAQATIIML